MQVCRARWRLLEWQIEAAYAAAVPEDEIAEAITLAMFPGSIPRFVEGIQPLVLVLVRGCTRQKALCN